jgi:hypothetical protein
MLRTPARPSALHQPCVYTPCSNCCHLIGDRRWGSGGSANRSVGGKKGDRMPIRMSARILFNNAWICQRPAFPGPSINGCH